MKKFDWEGFTMRKFVVSTKNSLETKDLVKSYNELLAKNDIMGEFKLNMNSQEKECYFGFNQGYFVATYNICNEERIVPWSEYMKDASQANESTSSPQILTIPDLLDMDGESVWVENIDNENVRIASGFCTVDVNERRLIRKGGSTSFRCIELGYIKVFENHMETLDEKKTIKTSDEESKAIRRTILEAAISSVCGDREDKYGKPEKSFGEIAKLWSSYLDVDLTGKDVAVMMCLFKIARIKTGTNKADNYIDLAGYAANAAELDGE